ncbi:MAG TPA: trigger factor [Burkholderiales bacterium]|nr:trigger factor [Burkholderiales bacterium]HXZ91763.1 trigger factor [Burkholderiales bacterium]
MAGDVETLGTLERRLSVSVALDEIERQVDARLKKLARDVKMPGFRPGKVPMKLVAQQYGTQVRSEVLGDAVQRGFNDAVKEANLKVAGYPQIEKREGGDDKSLEFSATFEVYPEVRLGDISAATIERPRTEVTDADVDRTIEILRKQRTQHVAVERAARDGDRATVDFAGALGGQPFDGGTASGFAFVIGEGRMLPEFEQGARGLAAGESRKFEVTFPPDYQGKEVAGKTAEFALSMKRVDEPRQPALDGEFAKSLGVADGDLGKMRADIRANVEREVAKRIDARVKSQTLQALLDSTKLELPKSLVQMEAQQLLERATADLHARGVRPEQVQLEAKAFEETAKRRVALGLIIGELARGEKLQPKPAEVRALIEQEAQGYESPAEVVKWFYMQPQRLSEMEGLALEGNVVNWVLSKAKVVDKAVSFDELMGGGS